MQTAEGSKDSAPNGAVIFQKAQEDFLEHRLFGVRLHAALRLEPPDMADGPTKSLRAPMKVFRTRFHGCTAALSRMTRSTVMTSK